MVLRLADSHERHIIEHERTRTGMLSQLQEAEVQHRLSMDEVNSAQAGTLTALSQSAEKILDEVRAARDLIKTEVLEELRKTRDTMLPSAAELATLNNQMATLSEVIAGTQAAAAPLAQLQERINALENQITPGDTSSGSHIKASYATVAASPIRQTQAMHSIVISSSEDRDSSEDIMVKIRQAVDANKSGIRVDRIRKARDQKVIVGCEDKLELQRIKQKFESSQPQLKVEER